MKITEILKNIGTTIGYVKTVGIVILAGLFIFTTCQRGYDKAHANELVKKITGLDVKNDLLHKENKEQALLIDKQQNEISRLKDSVKISKIKLANIKSENEKLQEVKNNIAKNILKTPTDSSYKFLTNVAYPYPGKLEYPFNEPQVKAVHMTYLEKQSLNNINQNLKEQITQLTLENLFWDTISNAYEEKSMMLKSMKINNQEIIQNLEIKNQLLESENKKNDKKKRFWRVLSLGQTVVIGTLLLFL